MTTAARRRSKLTISLLSTVMLVVALIAPPAAGQDEPDGVTPARVEGQTRFHTAAELARLTFQQADVAHLVRVDAFPDALAAAFAAGAAGGPILLTPREEVGVGPPTSPTVQVLEDLGAQRVVLVGGEAAISDSVADELRGAGYEVDRIEGTTRYQTASAVAMRYGSEVGVGEMGGHRTAMLASGETFADALAAGPVAANAGFPLLLTPQDRTVASVDTSLEQLDIDRIVVVGGAEAVAPEVVEHYEQQGYAVERWAGVTRTETATVVAEHARTRLAFDARLVLLARGDDFADALAASAHAGAHAAPLLLSQDPETLSGPTRDWLESACPDVEAIRAIGGRAAVSEATLADAVQAAGSCLQGLIECTNPVDGYTVERPSSWATNHDYLDSVPPCSLFDPDPGALRVEGNEIPADIGVHLFVDAVDFDDVAGADEQFEEELSRHDTTVDGRRAERLETRATGAGRYPEGTLTTRWAVDLDGHTLVAVSRSIGEPDYTHKVEVLDQMMATLSFHIEGRWRALPPAPIGSRIQHTATWTGREMIVWGGGDADNVRADGASWQADARQWGTIPPAPIAPRWSHEAAWTGDELLVWGGNAGPDHLAECFGDGAAYDRDTLAWRTLPDAPGEGRCGATSVWTGEELIIYGGHSAAGPPEPGDYADDAIAYDPAADAWRSTRPAPIAPRTGATSVWTGEEMIVYGGTAPDFTPLADGAAYDPTTDTWRAIAEPPLGPRSAVSAVWMDGELLVFGGRPQDSDTAATEAATYDPMTDTWQLVSDVPARHTPPTPAVWSGAAVHVVGGDTGDADAASFHSYFPEADSWVTQPSPPQSPRLFHTLVWTGEELVVWGGEARPGGPAGGAAWTPPTS